MIAGSLIDAAVVGDDGEVRVYVMVGCECGEATVLWQPELCSPEVQSASSPLVERFVHEDHETQDAIERLHSRYVRDHRAWRGGWVRVP